MAGVSGSSHVGLRINPQLEGGAITYTFTAGHYSKFGVPLNEFREEIISACLRNPALDTLHLHTGSQSSSLELIAEGIDRVVKLASEINHRRFVEGLDKKIYRIDIGGGLPAPYIRGQWVRSFSEFRALLSAKVPALLSGDFQIITEFGRHVNATCGWTVSRVESVKEQSGIRTVMIHVGSDLMLRECYCPGDWHHDLAVLTPEGELRSGEACKHNIAGPLCFSGDMLAREVMLARVRAGDYLLIGDTGAYTFSMWSCYNNRQMPKIVGYERNLSGEISFSELKERERVEKLVEEWS